MIMKKGLEWADLIGWWSDDNEKRPGVAQKVPGS
jgi:hypothetical protein